MNMDIDKRNKVIKELFNLNSEIKILQYSELLKGIPTQDLLKFSVFELQNRKEFETQDKSVAKNAKSFLADITLRELQNENFKFPTIDFLVDFLKENFKGKKICNGNGFKRFVVISLGDNGKFFNEYTQKFLNCDEEAVFLKQLFINQKTIGRVYYITESEFAKQKQIEQKQIEQKQIEQKQIEQKQEISETQRLENLRVVEKIFRKWLK